MAITNHVTLKKNWKKSWISEELWPPVLRSYGPLSCDHGGVSTQLCNVYSGVTDRGTWYITSISVFLDRAWPATRRRSLMTRPTNACLTPQNNAKWVSVWLQVSGAHVGGSGQMALHCNPIVVKTALDRAWPATRRRITWTWFMCVGYVVRRISL